MAVLGSQAAFEEDVVDRRPLLYRLGSMAKRQPLGAAGLLVVIVMIFAAIFAPEIAQYDPEENDFDAMFSPPAAAHLLGTDEFGRDIFSRIVWGARTAMLVGFVCATAAALGGLLVGVTSAYFGGKVDILLQRVVDVLIAFPGIILALAIVAVLGTDSIWYVMLAITIPLLPNCARVVRSTALSIREIPYVDAARACGFGHHRIVLRHMAPNVIAPFLIMWTTFLGQAILAEASLTFLGLGVQEPTPAWGLMLRSGAEEFAESAPWVPIFPGIAISLAVFGFNLFGDALRDVLDPKLRDQ
ncbi:MAG: ABC transporter permease subunit [Gammaproteobacteria bacterium]|nr:ABC transporter permease subunit [Gammaproteobacteria bacterium]